MAAPIRELADAYVTLLTAATLSVALEPERAYIPKFDLKQLNELHVSVIPREDDSVERFNRASWKHEVTIDIVLQKKYAALVDAELDALVDLADEVCEWCKEHFTPRPEKLTGATLQVLWDHPLLAEKKLFTTVVRLTLEEAR